MNKDKLKKMAAKDVKIEFPQLLLMWQFADKFQADFGMSWSFNFAKTPKEVKQLQRCRLSNQLKALFIVFPSCQLIFSNNHKFTKPSAFVSFP